MKSHPTRHIEEPESPEILQALRRGESWAVQAFAERYTPRIYHLAYRMCHDDELAKDAAQQTLTIALEKMHQFRGESRLITWLYQILFHECMRFRREFKRLFYFPTSSPEQWYQNVAVRTSLPEEVVMDEEQKRALLIAIDRLPPTLRSVLILRDIEGLSTREVAQVLRISETNVKVRLHRARRQLKEWFRQNTDPASQSPAGEP